jgi:predicted porin
MRKVLLATTAIAGVSLMAGGALAQTGGPLKLGVGGYFQAYGTWVTQSTSPELTPGAVKNFTAGSTAAPGSHRHEVDLKREAEIWFTGETKFDNGLIVGAQVELEAETCGDQIDESYLWFAGNWGRVLIGSTNGAAYKLSVGAPAIDANFDGQEPNYRLFNTGPAFGDPRFGQFSSQIDKTVSDISTDAEKVTYLSPRIAGFRAGLSYTPTNTEEASAGQAGAKGGSYSGMNPNNCTMIATGACTFPNWADIVNIGVNYEGNFGPIALQAFAGGERGFLQSVPAPAFAGSFHDRTTANTGVDLGFAGFHVGGGYFWDDNGASNASHHAWNVGVTYTVGPLTVGASYLNASRNRATLTAAGGGAIGPATVATVFTPVDAEHLDRIVVGARYQLAPGVDLRTSYQYYAFHEAFSSAVAGTTGTNANNNYVNAVVFGTNVRF